MIAFRRGAVDAATIAGAPRLRLIQRLGESPATIDLAAAAAGSVAVSCLPRRTLRQTADHALALMLALSRRLRAGERAVREGAGGSVAAPLGQVAYNWPGLQGIETLAGRRLGIVGLGEVGSLVAQRAAAFEMAVTYTARSRLAPERERELGVRWQPLDRLLGESDFVSVHVPGGAENRALLGAREIGLMRPGAFLVNTSRGAVVDEDALWQALSEGRLGGAGLDVHAREPRPPGDRFCALANVVLTPHVGGGSRTGVLAEVGAMFDNFRAAIAGRRPRHAIVVAPGVAA